MRLRGPPAAPPRVATLTEALRRAAESAQGITLVDLRERETFAPFAALHRGARRVAGALRRRGVADGDRVAMVLPTGEDFIEVFFGVLYAGAVPVPLYPPARLGRLPEYLASTARMIGSVGAALLVSDARTALLLGEAVARARPRLGSAVASELRGSRDEAEAPADPDALALIQHSSGSTADPKPVALTHRNLAAQLAALEALMGDGNVGAAWLPLYHDMGLVGCLLSAVYQARPLALMGPEGFLARPALWLRAISRHRATISAAPDFAYGLCLKRVRDDELEGVDLSRWRLALDGAEAISPDTLRRFAARFAPWGFRAEALTPVYGLSEASLAVTASAVGRGPRSVSVDADALAARGEVRPGGRSLVSVGAPVPGVEVEVRDGSGAALGEGRVGRVFARGASVMAGYFGSPRAPEDSWLDTGDLGFIDGGELVLCGRAKDVIILRGANHAPQEFEACVDGVRGARTGCVVAVGVVPEGEDGERVVILVERAPDATEALAGEVAAAVLARTGVAPHAVVPLGPGTLPRTSSGKLRRGEALRRYLAGTLDAPGAVDARAVGAALLRSAAGYARAALG